MGQADRQQFAVYGAIEGLHDDGFRNFSPSDISASTAMSAIAARTPNFISTWALPTTICGAAATVPVELLQQYWGATYTTPQTTTNQVAYANLTGKVEVTPTWTIEGIAHAARFGQQTQWTAIRRARSLATPMPRCSASATAATAGQRSERRAACQSFRARCDPRRNRSNHDAIDHRRVFGAGDQHRPVLRARQPLCRRRQLSTASVTRFVASAELGTIGSNYVVNGGGIFLGQSGNPVSIGPVSLRTTNQYHRLYALDTFDVTKAFSITAGGRFNDARIALEDQLGSRAQRQIKLRPLQSDHRRHLQDHVRS